MPTLSGDAITQTRSIGWLERLRSCLGALVGIAFIAGLMHVTLGDSGMVKQADPILSLYRRGHAGANQAR
ncbi:hypothetical protein M0D69_32355 [Caballeronia sp. SEWSISQ10-4 2]|uniref:hypothetical protein n=1 Tax=Caballeronia sp. SEWSISQ10-4 2 TaxID=2937438 RepID=UPI00265567F8|nr:hypothetical protein [Caballeronia sp. SEWSISQ10-4 2]MDN7182628.1 hypothetical protein [Caballeronia sp. SEWSISQ10-4 2]